MKQRLEIMRAEIMTRIANSPMSSSKPVYETGNDDSGWYAKVVNSDGQYEVIVYDADGDVRNDKGTVTQSVGDAIAHADNAIDSASIEVIPPENP